MKVELTNRELKDIYSGLGWVVTQELYHITQMEQENIEENKELLKTMKERNERQMILIKKITKLINWEKD